MTVLHEPTAQAPDAPTGTEWEELLDAGNKAALEIDTAKWVLGDLAGKVTKRYGENRLGLYASAINRNVDVMRDYRRVSAFYESRVRATFSDAVSWSHYRMAMRLKTPEAALAFLETCDAETLTVAAAADVLDEKLGKPKKAKKLFDGKVRVSRVAGRPCLIVEDVALLPYLDKIVHLIVKEEKTA